MSITAQRLATLVQRELAVIISNTIRDEKVGYINLTEVKVTRDLSHAKIYYSILSDDKDLINLAGQLLETNKPILRSELAKKLKNLRRQPDLVFEYDTALAYGNYIDKLIKQTK
jgi:ribosome-binding factor A